MQCIRCVKPGLFYSKVDIYTQKLHIVYNLRNMRFAHKTCRENFLQLWVRICIFLFIFGAGSGSDKNWKAGVWVLHCAATTESYCCSQQKYCANELFLEILRKANLIFWMFPLHFPQVGVLCGWWFGWMGQHSFHHLTFKLVSKCIVEDSLVAVMSSH